MWYINSRAGNCPAVYYIMAGFLKHFSGIAAFREENAAAPVKSALDIFKNLKDNVLVRLSGMPHTWQALKLGHDAEESDFN